MKTILIFLLMLSNLIVYSQNIYLDPKIDTLLDTINKTISYDYDLFDDYMKNGNNISKKHVIEYKFHKYYNDSLDNVIKVLKYYKKGVCRHYTLLGSIFCRDLALECHRVHISPFYYKNRIVGHEFLVIKNSNHTWGILDNNQYIAYNEYSMKSAITRHINNTEPSMILSDIGIYKLINNFPYWEKEDKL